MLLLFVACNSPSGGGLFGGPVGSHDEDTASPTEGDADTDADSDTDTDADSDADADTDTDADPASDFSHLEDRTWAFHLGDGYPSEPPWLGNFLQLDEVLLMEVLDVEDTLHVRLAWADQFSGTLEQAASWDTDDEDVPFATAPALQVVAEEWTFQGMMQTNAYDTTLVGTFSSDGALVESARLSLVADASEWPGLFGLETGDEMCDLLADYGDTCIPCSDENPYCLRFTFEYLTGEEVTPLELVRVR